MTTDRAPGRSTLEFISNLALNDVPASVVDRARLLLADLAAVCVGGRSAPAPRIAAEYAEAVYPQPEATLLYDGRRTGTVGAAFANGVLANALDFDDGHRLTKGHPGAMVIPGVLAVAQHADASPDQVLAAVIVGYEISVRAGIALHARDPAYHASGAWGSIGVAAASSRLLGLGPEQTAAAIGLAEYHAPIAPIMRSCGEPAMTKDCCAIGASNGVASALLAARGFTAVGAEFMERDSEDLGSRWRLCELYVKPHPCCRWSQGAIAAALQARASVAGPADISRVTIRTFEAASGLAQVIPVNTEEAQYNLAWPVACALVHRRFGVKEVLGPFDDEQAAAMFERIEIRVEDELTAAFPARRLTAVDLELRDGSTISVGPLEAGGEPGDPRWAEVIMGKVAELVDARLDLAAAPVAGIARADAAQLLGLLCAAVASGEMIDPAVSKDRHVRGRSTAAA